MSLVLDILRWLIAIVSVLATLALVTWLLVFQGSRYQNWK